MNGGWLPDPKPALLLYEASGFTNINVNGKDGMANLERVRAALGVQGYVPLKLGDGRHDGWSRSR